MGKRHVRGNVGMCATHHTHAMAKTPRRHLWQHKSSLFRRVAAESGRDEKLLAALPRLAIADPDPAVRRAALSRCADIALAQEAAYVDADEDNRTYARALYFSLMAGTHENAPSLSARLRLVEVQADMALTLHIAIYSPDQVMRDAAQRRLERDRHIVTRTESEGLGTADPIFNKVRSRAMLRRAIATVACEVERSLRARNQDEALKWTDALERFVGDWPARWPLPHAVARTSLLLQQVLFRPPPVPALPAPVRKDMQFEAPPFNLPKGLAHTAGQR